MNTQNVQNEEGVYSAVEEPVVSFKIDSDRIVREIINEEINQVLVHISGYDLKINFNMQYLNTIADIEAACDGISQLFREIITERLLEAQQQNH